VDQQLLIKSAGGNSLPDVPLPDIPLPDVPLSDVTLPDVALPEARLYGSVGEECTSPRVAEEVMIVVFRYGWGSCLVHFLCSNLFISGIDFYICRKVFESLKVYFIYGFCIGFMFIGFILFIVLWDIMDAAFLQLLACKEPPCDGVDAQ